MNNRNMWWNVTYRRRCASRDAERGCDTGRDLVAGGHVQSLEVDDDGNAKFRFQVGPDDPGDLVKQAREAVEAIDGIGEVKINVQLPQMAPSGGGSSGGGGLKPGSVPAPWMNLSARKISLERANFCIGRSRLTGSFPH